MEKHYLLKLYQTASEFFRYSFRATLFSPLMNACDFVLFQKYEKILSILLGHFIKHKPLISKEWVHITHPNTFLYFTTTDGQIFLSCHNQKLMKEKKKTIFFFKLILSLFFWFSARLQFTFVTQIRRDATVSAWLLAWNAKSSF